MSNVVAIGSISGRKNNSEHKHREFEMLYFTQGQGVVRIGGRDYPFSPGCFVLIPPGVPHSTRSDSGYGDIFMTMLQFSLPAPEAICFTDNENGAVRALLTNLYAEFHLKRNNWQNITDALLAAIFEYAVSWGAGSSRYGFVDRLENTLVSNLSNSAFDIEGALEGIPLSRDYINKVFKQKTGKTPLNYLLEKRISFAKQLLLSRPSNFMKVKEIASAVGFQDQYYFSRVFKRATGKSPSQWGA